jgi:hypothetical protein
MIDDSDNSSDTLVRASRSVDAQQECLSSLPASQRALCVLLLTDSGTVRGDAGVANIERKLVGV